MVRAFQARPIPPDVLDRLLDAVFRAPSAGFSQGLDAVVLDGPAETARYWDVALPAERRAGFAFPGLLDAPVLVVLVTAPGAYLERYAEPDKAATGLGSGTEAWPVPYWFVDGGMAADHLLLAAVDAGLGALFFGLFAHHRAVLDALGVPGDRTGIGVVALGYPVPDRPGRSASRPRRPLDESIHRGGW